MLSFVPQIHRILSRRDWTGISLLYLLFNLIVATENFTLGSQITVVARDLDRPGMVRYPRTIGNWLNLAQLGAVWLCHTLL